MPMVRRIRSLMVNLLGNWVVDAWGWTVGRNSVDGAAIGKWVVLVGLGIAAVGGMIWLASRLGLPLGNLPGDVRIDRPGFTFRAPIATCILLSVLLTVLVNVVLRLLRR